MNALLVYPEFEATFWSGKHILGFVGKRAAFFPLGLLTVAAMLPESWNKKVVDLNVRRLTDKHIRWANYVFISSMATQKDSANKVIARCRRAGVPVVLGGPILEGGCDGFSDASYFLLGEVEETLPDFLADLERLEAKKIYSPKRFPDIAATPVPLWKLISHRDYSCGLVGYSRGCPFRCTFCNIAVLNGRAPRPKAPCQFLREIEAIYDAGFRGTVMLADDNFIGKVKAAKEMLAKLIVWQRERGFPFEFIAEAPITIASDPGLMKMMVEAGFKKVFLGLETPNEACLKECGKRQNLNRDLIADVKRIQSCGLIPMSGFIVGFDNDPPDSFDALMIDFIQKTGIIIAMVGVLQAQPGTELYAELRQQGRLVASNSGNNTDCYPNFTPKMPLDTLVRGYKRIVETIYSPKRYYERICNFLKDYSPFKRPKKKFSMSDFLALMRANIRIGLFGGWRVSYYYWKSLLSVFLYKKWPAFPDVVALQIYGVHFREIAKGIRES